MTCVKSLKDWLVDTTNLESRRMNIRNTISTRGIGNTSSRSRVTQVSVTGIGVGLMTRMVPDKRIAMGERTRLDSEIEKRSTSQTK